MYVHICMWEWNFEFVNPKMYESFLFNIYKQIYSIQINFLVLILFMLRDMHFPNA